MEANAPDQQLLRTTLTVFRRRRAVIATLVLAAAAVAALSSAFQTSMYRSSAAVVVKSGASVSTGGAFVSDLELQNEVVFATSTEMRSLVAITLGYSPNVVVDRGGPSTLSFTAIDSDSVAAAKAANIYADIYIQLRRESKLEEYLAGTAVIQQRLDDVNDDLAALEAEYDEALSALDPTDAASISRLEAEYAPEFTRLETQRTRYVSILEEAALSVEFLNLSGTRVIVPAVPPLEPYAPDMIANIARAALIALVIAIGFAFLLDYLDDTVRTKDDFEIVTHPLPTLTVVPRLESWSNADETHIVTIEQPQSSPAEAYRSLRTSLAFLGVDRPMKIIQVTSPRMRDGKSTTSANLAVTMALSGQSVVLVDADLRRPRIHRFFNLDNSVGMTSLLTGDAFVEDVIQTVTTVPNLSIIPAGPPRSISAELLSAGPLAATLRALAAQFDVVVVDTPPTLAVADPLIVAGAVDAVLLVASAANTHRSQVAASLESLANVGAPMVGTVLNAFDARAAGYYGYGYGYGYGGYGGYAYGGYAPDDDSAKKTQTKAKASRRGRRGAKVPTPPELPPVAATSSVDGGQS